MSSTIEEKIELETWGVIQQLKRDYVLTTEDDFLVYEIAKDTDNKTFPLPDNQIKIIERLERLGVLKIKSKHYTNPRGSILDVASFQYELSGKKPTGFFLKMEKAKFEEIFEKYSKKYQTDSEKNDVDFYVKKRGDYFYYNGDLLNVSKNTDYYKVFCGLYALLPQGGEVAYQKIGVEVKSRIPKTKDYSQDRMRKFIQTNLTDKNNGFMRYASISQTEDNSKPLISVIRGKGIYFNNRPG